MKAIRIDGKEVISWNALLARQCAYSLHTHAGLFFYWKDREGLTDEQADAAIEAGRITWGFVHWDSKTGEFPFTVKENDWREGQYDSVEGIREMYGGD